MDIQEHITPSVEEQANVVTHGFGFLLSLMGMAYLLHLGLENHASQLELLGLIIFGFSMVLVYFTSTIYHYSTKPDIRFRLQVLDHISIYFLIAGTHTPFLFYYLNNATGHFFLILLWSLVGVGVLYKLFFFGRFQLLSVLFYLFMGWMAVFTMPPMLDQLAPGILFWVIFGGIFYTLGVIFFLWEKLPYHHAIWHLFVIVGSIGHFIAVATMVQGI